MVKRVLLLEHNVDGTVGGSHICLLGICRHLEKKAWFPTVCFYENNELVPTFRKNGLDVHILKPFSPIKIALGRRHGVFRILAQLQSTLNFLQMVAVRPFVWIRILRKLKVDAVHLNNSCGGDADLIIAAKMMGLPVTAHQRGFPPRFGRMERLLSKRMGKIIAVSDIVMEHLIELGVPSSLVVRIHDGIELDRLQQQRQPEELRAELGLRADRQVVGMIGNVKYWKGQETLVDAIPLILSEFPNTLFLFVGKVADDLYKERLDEKLEAADLQSSVVFTGYRSDATDLIALMDVVVHASIEAEPFGLVVLEAMGKGKAVVATELGGPKETVIDGVTGSLFESGNPQSLASAVCHLLDDSSVRQAMSNAGIAHVQKNFNAHLNTRAIEVIFCEVFGT